MEYLIYKTFAKPFFLKKEDFNKYIKSLQNEMIQKMFFEKANEFGNYYIFHFEKIYWNSERIENEIDGCYKVQNGLYAHPMPTKKQYFTNRSEIFKMIKEKEPFDIKLYFEDKGTPRQVTRDMIIELEDK